MYAPFLARLPLYLRLIRMDKPIGSLLLLWPTLSRCGSRRTAVRRRGFSSSSSLGTVLMRSAGCAINDYADRDFDRT